MEMGDAEIRRHLRQLEWSIWKTRAANFRLYHKACKLLAALVTAYTISFFLVFVVFILNLSLIGYESSTMVQWSYPATTHQCEGEASSEQDLTNVCVVGPRPVTFLPRRNWNDPQEYYDGSEWQFRFYAPLVRYYKYLRRNDFKGEYQRHFH